MGEVRGIGMGFNGAWHLPGKPGPAEGLRQSAKFS
jgi:hypothetical protein